MAKYEGRWLCPYCGAENLGRFESCEGHGNSGCGAARGKVRFYLPENSPIVTDPALLDDANSGQDWVCDHCDGANKNAYQGHKITNCVHCAEPRTEKDYTVEKRTFSTSSVPTTAKAAAEPRKTGEQIRSERTARRDALATERAAAVAQRQDTPPKNAARFFLFGALVVLGLAALFAIWYFFLSTTATPLRVTDKSWERVLVLQEKEIRQDEGWSVRSGGRILSQYEKYKETIQVVDYYVTKTRMVSQTVQDGQHVCGKTDLGNGYFEDRYCPSYKTIQVPEDYQDPVYKDKDVYETWYTYEYDHWETIRSFETEGKDNTPYWADVTAGFDERTQHQSETYRLVIATEEGPLTQTTSLSTWTGVTVGQTVIGNYNRMGSLLSIDY